MSIVCAVIVTYEPDPAAVRLLIERIRHSVQSILIVDNGSSNAGELRHVGGRLIELGENYGVAVAQNTGIDYALADEFDFVILFDQDSLPASDMVWRLLRSHEQLTAQGVRVAAVGPNWRDRNNGKRRRGLTDERPFIKEDMLISSGCLISLDAIRDVGRMAGALFIDHVDAEWCMRVTQKHRQHRNRMETEDCWKLFVVADAKMGHALGRGALQLGTGMAGAMGGVVGVAGGAIGIVAGAHLGIVGTILSGMAGAAIGGAFALLVKREFHWASPTRLYYGFRNSVHLWIRSSYPLRWKLQDAGYRTVQVALVCLGAFPANRFILLRLILRGVWHGLIGKLGRLS